MAERRAFSTEIVCTDKFMAMSQAAQCLYFMVGIIAEDKGVIRNLKATAYSMNCAEQVIYELIDNGYITKIPNGYKIVHWYENNGVGETAKKRNNYEYRQFREIVMERDGYECQICGSTENLEVHHIKAFALYPELRTEPSNGITLCHMCHRKIHQIVEKDDGSV